MRAGDGPAPPLGLDTVAALLDRASVAINAAARAAGCGAQGLEKLRQRPRAKDSPGAGDPWPRKLCSTYGRKRRLRPVGETLVPGLTGLPRVLSDNAALTLADGGFAALSGELNVCLRLLGPEPLASRKRPLPLVAHAAFAAGEALALSDPALSRLSIQRSLGTYRSIPPYMRRAVLVQHLSTAFAYAVFDDPRKLKDFAAVCRYHRAYHQAQQLTLELARHEFPCTPASVTDMYDFLTSCRRSEDLVLRWRDSLEWENITEQFDKAVDHLARSSLRHAIILAARALEVLRLKFATSGEADDEMAIALQAPLLFRLAAALGKDTAHCWTAADLQPIRSLTELYYDGHPPTPGTLLSSVSIALGVQYLFLNETVRAHAGPEDESAEAFTERVADSAAEFAWAKIGRLVPRWEGWLTRNVCNSKNFYIYIARVFCRRGNFHVPIRLLDDLFDHSAGDPPQPDNRKGSHFGALRVLRRDLAAQAAAETGRKSWTYEPAISDFMDRSLGAENEPFGAKRGGTGRRNTRCSTDAETQGRLRASRGAAAVPRKRTARVRDKEEAEVKVETDDVPDELGFGATDQDFGIAS